MGAGSRVGPDCVFGPWAKIGRGVTLGAEVRLGTHSRIGDGTHIPEGMVVGDNGLITPQGVFENRTGGLGASILEEAAIVSGPFGHFLIPLDPGDPDELIDQLVDDHQWGRSDALEPCRLLRPPRPEETEGALKVLRARQEAFNRDAEASERALEDWVTAERHLREQGIPELEQDYRDKLDEVSVHALAKIKGEVDQYRRDAHEKIRELNEVLIRAVYNPVLNSCAQFRIRRVADPLISSFEADLKEAINGTFAKERNLEAVQRVIGRVGDHDDPAKRSERARLLDLANWYRVDLEELERLPDGQPGDRLNLFDVPANQSGGEKQRLMAILFGAGVAHMFGTSDPSRSADALGLSRIVNGW